MSECFLELSPEFFDSKLFNAFRGGGFNFPKFERRRFSRPISFPLIADQARQKSCDLRENR